MITCKEELMEAIAVRDVNKNYLFKLTGRIYHWRGVRDAIPNAATEVICTDDWKIGDTDIPAWNPESTAEEPS